MAEIAEKKLMPTFVAVGDNPAIVFGLDARTRAARIAAKAGMATGAAPTAGEPCLLSDMDYSWDPTWLKAIAARPGSALMLEKRAILVHVPADRDASEVAATMTAKADFPGTGYDLLDAETVELNNHELRKRERPFVLSLDPPTPNRSSAPLTMPATRA